MAVAVDRASLLTDQIIRSFRPLRDALVAIGILYSMKSVIKISYQALRGATTFGLSKLRFSDFVRQYGEWAIVTGCTQGIGRAYAEELAKMNMNIILISRNQDKLNDLSNELNQKYKIQTVVVQVDFSQGSEVGVKHIEGALVDKDIGVLVNNVGVITDHPKYLTEMDYGDIWNHINVNVGAATIVTRMVLPIMEKKRKGAIINLASSAALLPLPLNVVYSATKAYVDHFSEGLAAEVAHKGIVVQTVDPMYVCTNMTSYTELMREPSLFVPSPQTFVRSSIRTLGLVQRTTGYWPHSLQVWLAGFVPDSIYIRVSLYINQWFRAIALKERK
jgi:short-subunit dehydrogenase